MVYLNYLLFCCFKVIRLMSTTLVILDCHLVCYTYYCTYKCCIFVLQYDLCLMCFCFFLVSPFLGRTLMNLPRCDSPFFWTEVKELRSNTQKNTTQACRALAPVYTISDAWTFVQDISSFNDRTVCRYSFFFASNILLYMFI